MAQTSNGSITITDLTDITDVYLEYCMAADSITTAEDIIAKTIWTPPERGWSTEYPTWQSGYQIWIREVTKKEGITQLEHGTPYLDKAVNQINNNISNIQTKIKKIWSNSTGSYMASGINGNDVIEDNVNTYGFNSKSTTTGISFNYNAIPLTSLGTDGLKLYDSNNIPIAQFNDTGITMGKSDGSQSYLFEDYHSLQMIDKEGNPYFYISDLRDKDDNWQATIEEVFSGDGTTRDFYVQLPVSQEISAIDSSDVSNSATRAGKEYTFANIPSEGATITITYKTTDVKAKAYTLGIRKTGKVGAMSFAEGYNTIASGIYSHAEGMVTTAKGSYSHAEGYYTKANGSNSHAEGYFTKASGHTSHVQGKYNIEDPSAYTKTTDTSIDSNKTYYTLSNGKFSEVSSPTTSGLSNYYEYTPDSAEQAFIIGNGAYDSNRSNALTVDWNGNIELALDTTAASGTTDGDLYSAITALGWQNDVIV